MFNTPNNWGGARNSKTRISRALSLAQCQDLQEAAYNAIAHNMPLNRFITINWSILGISEKDGINATGRYLKLASDYLRKKGFKFAWLYVRETNDIKTNNHLHLLAHIPNEISKSFFNFSMRWLKQIRQGEHKKGSIKTRTIGGNSNIFNTNFDHYKINLETLLVYILKGSNKEAAQALDLPAWERGGEIIGKRCGRSNNISKPP